MKLFHHQNPFLKKGHSTLTKDTIKTIVKLNLKKKLKNNILFLAQNLMPSPTSRTCNDRYKRTVDICLTFCGSAINDGCKKIGHTHTQKKRAKIELKAAAKRKLDVSPLPRSFSYYYVENGRRKKQKKTLDEQKSCRSHCRRDPKRRRPLCAHTPVTERLYYSTSARWGTRHF